MGGVLFCANGPLPVITLTQVAPSIRIRRNRALAINQKRNEVIAPGRAQSAAKVLVGVLPAATG